MKLTVKRELLLKPLQMVIGVVESKQTLPILANVLIRVDEQQLAITATDLEVELIGQIALEQPAETVGAVTVSGRKLMDICRTLPEKSDITLDLQKDKLIVRSGRSRFTLGTLPTTDFPDLKDCQSNVEFTLGQHDLRTLAQRTHFAMAQQDVRFYLNGMLLEVNEGVIRTVATDGHRLALNTTTAPEINNNVVQVILPRKGVTELMRLLDDSDKDIKVSVGDSHARICGDQFIFTSKLIDGRYPDYERVLPKGGNKEINLCREEFKQALLRASVLSNEKIRGVRLQVHKGVLNILSNNPEHEESEESINIDYNDENLEFGVNVKYVLDILNTIQEDKVKLTLTDADSSILIESMPSDGNSLYVVMPMRF